MSAPLTSPCTGVCRIDAVSGVCAGCRRTLDEIAGWQSMGDAGRRVVWRRLALRRADAETPPPGAGSAETAGDAPGRPD